MDDIVREAYIRLYPTFSFDYDAAVTYSRRFSPYNARVRLSGRRLKFSLSHSWKGVDQDIQIGLVQSLMARLFKKRQAARTLEMNLYESFLKRLHAVTPKTEHDGTLRASFDRVNEKYFFGLIEVPNLRWGGESRRTLAHYDLHTDAITVSAVFRNGPPHLLDYVMHHEMLHKKHKFKPSGRRSHFHTPAFRTDESLYESAERLENELTAFLRSLGRRRRRAGGGGDLKGFFGLLGRWM